MERWLVVNLTDEVQSYLSGICRPAVQHVTLTSCNNTLNVFVYCMGTLLSLSLHIWIQTGLQRRHHSHTSRGTPYAKCSTTRHDLLGWIGFISIQRDPSRRYRRHGCNQTARESVKPAASRNLVPIPITLISTITAGQVLCHTPQSPINSFSLARRHAGGSRSSSTTLARSAGSGLMWAVGRGSSRTTLYSVPVRFSLTLPQKISVSGLSR